jgi:hypothetical protein
MLYAFTTDEKNIFALPSINFMRLLLKLDTTMLLLYTYYFTNRLNTNKRVEGIILTKKRQAMKQIYSFFARGIEPLFELFLMGCFSFATKASGESPPLPDRGRARPNYYGLLTQENLKFNYWGSD